MKLFKSALTVGVATLGLVATMSAHAESKFASGATAAASPSLDFRIIIPEIISFQVGSVGTTIDMVEFDMTGAADAPKVGDASLFARTNGGVVPVKLVSNVGNVAITGTTLGALTNAAGNTISYGEIDVSSDGAIGNPVLVDGAKGAAQTVTATAGVVNTTSNWTFKYKNSAVVAAGTYGGVNTQNGRVVYTASKP